jgi:hypothetical protein
MHVTRKNCTTKSVLATEIDYVTLLLCVDMFWMQIWKNYEFWMCFWIFGDCFSGHAFSAVDENHLILFSKYYIFISESVWSPMRLRHCNYLTFFVEFIFKCQVHSWYWIFDMLVFFNRLIIIISSWKHWIKPNQAKKT